MGYFVNVLDLFSGIGGFSLGLERAGMRTVAFCEIEPFCRRVLAKHWPGVPIYHDITKLRGTDVGAVDVICGGFPCQDISIAGKGAGIEGSRSGLWSEYARIIGELRPRFVIVENVAALLNRGLDTVLGDLAALGYDAEWHCIPAYAVGAPHIRDRIWIIAHPQHTDADSERPHRTPVNLEGNTEFRDEQECQLGSLGETMADTNKPRLERWIRESLLERPKEWPLRPGGPRWIGSPWFIEPGVGRVVDGISARMDRLKGLGNAVVPQIPEIIGRAIMSAVTSQDSTKGE
jgi:DNA (cytosine-5)-methyltransferase 1